MNNLKSLGNKLLNMSKDPTAYLSEVNTLQKSGELLLKMSEQVPILIYIYEQIKLFNEKTDYVIVLQFSVHPSNNLAVVFRAYNPRLHVEAPPISDVIMLSEIEDNTNVIPRLEELFSTIHKALNSIQVVNPTNSMEVIH